MKNRQERIEELVYISNPSPYDSNRYYPGAVVVAEQKLAKKALVIIKQLQEENKKLKEDKKEIFQSLDKELRLREVLSCDRQNRDSDQIHRIISGAENLKLTLIREKFKIFKEKYLPTKLIEQDMCDICNKEGEGTFNEVGPDNYMGDHFVCDKCQEDD